MSKEISFWGWMFWGDSFIFIVVSVCGRDTLSKRKEQKNNLEKPRPILCLHSWEQEQERSKTKASWCHTLNNCCIHDYQSYHEAMIEAKDNIFDWTHWNDWKKWKMFYLDALSLLQLFSSVLKPTALVAKNIKQWLQQWTIKSIHVWVQNNVNKELYLRVLVLNRREKFSLVLFSQ